jgi:putative aldouronate transport system permease protein
MRTRKKTDWFVVVNNGFLIVVALMCIVPLIHILAVSFSSSTIAATGTVTLWPKDFTLSSYEFVAKRTAFWQSMFISLQRIALGGTLNVLLTILIAYPLSKEKGEFRIRSFYSWSFFITMIFGAGLIPTYMLIRQLGLIDTIWALVLPGAVPVFSVILLLNFFRAVPKELSESAFMDGAGHWITLWRIYVPVSMPAIATILLFSLVQHWNSWFDGLIYMNDPSHYPLQSYIQTIVVQRSFDTMTQEEAKIMATISDKTMRSAQIFLGALPIICVYPFLQRFFVKGIVLGSVKG